MKERREFLKVSLAATAGAMIGHISPVMASVSRGSTFPPGIIYTKEAPGKWAKKVRSHLPVVTIENGRVRIETRHPMTELHYIVRHTLVSGSGDVLGEKTFYPSDGKAISVFEVDVKGYPVLYATSFCNKHDLWLTVLLI